MERICIAADSTFDMTLDMVQQYNVEVCPSYVRMGDTDYLDYPDLKQSDLFDYFRSTKKLPQTAAANPTDYEGFFKKCLENHDAVVFVAKSSGVSSCYANAAIAAEGMEHVYVLDSLTISSGSALLAMEAARLKDTLSAKELFDHLTAYRDKIVGSFIIETLEYLHEGGRCSTLAYLGASTLQIRQSINIREGKLVVGKKYMGTYRRALKEFIETTLAQREQMNPDVIMISHAIQDEALLQGLIDQIDSLHYFKEIIPLSVCAAIACHGGPNAFGLFTVIK
ncbi:Fatty acid-binding protein [bioreactor metagenome]|uniref:Fatty acid-binding protein n=1 Tax=bioreactor metagenome TaxID=1076179 RepID=A0A645A8P3_9ZZZZ|nr:DegV family protein [Christensenella sp.]